MVISTQPGSSGMRLLNLDTHVLVRALQGGLETDEIRLLENRAWGIASIVLWEIGKLNQLNRLRLHLDHPRMLDTLRQITIWPLDLEIARACGRLDFQGDPADEIIAATSLVHDVPLLTHDRRILKSKIVPLAP